VNPLLVQLLAQDCGGLVFDIKDVDMIEDHSENVGPPWCSGLCPKTEPSRNDQAKVRLAV
jgi:hypothetical protein